MIYLSTLQPKEVYLTLREKATITGTATPYYTWQIQNRDSLEWTIFSPDNFSTSPYYDAFTISVGTPSSLTGSSVQLYVEQGQYDYIITQTDIQYNLSITGSVVEVGILQIVGTSTPITQFTQSDTNTTKIFNYI
jgi:hypothetical protein